MHIRKLELRGFKSFPDATVFHFSRGISGIVGPNGCGKSNVVDAVRWCLGEQRAKRLRGQAMQDIIFAGSEGRAELATAEVSLTFEATDEPFPGEYARLDEIQVTRRITRDGNSEYLINFQKVRLKDVQELFLDSGASNPLYSIIEQGRIGEIVRARPEDRRSLIEEAAGISRYKVKRKEAEGRLNDTRQNLERVTDVVDGLTDRLKRLEKQVGKVIRYRRLKTLVRQGEILLGLARYQGLSADRKVLTERLRGAQAQERTLARDLERRDAETRSDREREAHLDAVVGKHRDQLSEAEASRREKESNRQYLQRERDDLSTRMEASNRQLGGAKEDRIAAQQRIAGIGRESQETAEELRSQEALFDTEKTQARDVESAARERRRRVEAGRNAVLEHTRERARIAAKLEGGQAREDELKRRLEQLESDAGDAGGELAEVDRQIAEARAEVLAAEALVQAVSERQRGLAGELKNAENNRTEATGSHRRADELLRRAERTGARVKAQLDSLLSVHRSRSGVDADLVKLLSAAGVLGTLADCLEVSSDRMAAIEVVLGAALDAVLVEDLTTAEAVLGQAEGRVTVVVVGAAEPGDFTDTALVGVRANAAGHIALKALIGDVRTAPSLFEAGSVTDSDAVVVLGDAPLLVRGSVIRAGRQGSAGAAILDRKRQIAALEAELDIALQAVAAAKRAVDEAQVVQNAANDAVDVARGALEAVKGEAAEARLGLDGGRRRQGELERGRKREAERASRLTDARERADKELLKLGHDLIEQAARVQLVEAAIDRLEGELRAEQSALIDESGAVEAARERLAERASDLAALRERIRSQQLAHTSQETLLRAATRAEHEASTALGQAKVRLREIEADEGRCAEELGELAILQEVVRGALDEEGGRLAQVRERLASADLERDAVRTRRDEATAQRMELEQAVANTKLGIAQVREALDEKYEVSVAGMLDRLDRMGVVTLDADEGADGTQVPESVRPKDRPDEDVYTLRITAALLDDEAELAGWQERQDKARRVLSRMGEVNLVALSEYVELAGEYEGLDTQRADLERSVDTIRRTIARLNRVSRERFRETFERVDGYFREMYPRLVGGGKAQLKLTNEDDLLDTGVEVYVQPPGKRLQTLTLLSGGETAMVAIALIFSLFRVKPSPFCLLDEVDAPLDEANGARFNLMLSEMASLSQFIVITHNKKTMEAVETLYGVTMPRPGVSRLVTVKLD